MKAVIIGEKAAAGKLAGWIETSYTQKTKWKKRIPGGAGATAKRSTCLEGLDLLVRKRNQEKEARR